MPRPPSFAPARGARGRGPLKLPAEGRKGPIPAWPLDEKATSEERRLWRELWVTPHAVAWEKLRWTRVVARYTRVLLLAEAMNKDALSEARQLEDKLGLTPKAMRLLLWEIVVDEVKEKREESGARGRIAAV